MLRISQKRICKIENNQLTIKFNGMEINWIIFAVVLIFAIVLIVFLIKRNMKDKDDVMNALNEPEIEDVPESKEDGKN